MCSSDLKTLGFTDITGADLREDRRKEVERLHSIRTLSQVDATSLASVDAIIISTPPNHHAEYLRAAVEAGKHVFVEASVVAAGLPELDALARKKGVIVAPSCTLRFHPAVKQVASLVASGSLGRVANFSYHSGQYLPDWHPWEKVADFYVSNPETGGAREIVPFELTWSYYKGGKRHCGRCGTCNDRKEAFQKHGLTDPVEYEV